MKPSRSFALPGVSVGLAYGGFAIAEALFGIGSVTCFAQASPPVSTLSAEGEAALAVCFEGYLGANDDTVFVLSLRNKQGKVSASAWLKPGQAFAGHVLWAFDPGHEIVSLRNPAGQIYRLPLVSAKFSEEQDEVQRQALARAMVFVEETRRIIRKQFDFPLEFTIDLDGATMPDSVRERFRAQQEKEEQRGGYLVGIFVEGEWVFSPYRDQSARLIPPQLDDQNRREVEAAYAVIYAEGMARAIAQRKRNGRAASR